MEKKYKIVIAAAAVVLIGAIGIGISSLRNRPQDNDVVPPDTTISQDVQDNETVEPEVTIPEDTQGNETTVTEPEVPQEDLPNFNGEVASKVTSGVIAALRQQSFYDEMLMFIANNKLEYNTDKTNMGVTITFECVCSEDEHHYSINNAFVNKLIGKDIKLSDMPNLYQALQTRVGDVFGSSDKHNAEFTVFIDMSDPANGIPVDWEFVQENQEN